MIRELSTFTLTTVTIAGAVYASKGEQRANEVAGQGGASALQRPSRSSSGIPLRTPPQVVRIRVLPVDVNTAYSSRVFSKQCWPGTAHNPSLAAIASRLRGYWLYSHMAKCPLAVRSSRAELAGPMGCFASDNDQFCVRSKDGP